MIAREPVKLRRDDPIVLAVSGAARDHFGSDPVVRSDYGWMDSGVLVEAGIPCVVYGPTGAGVHTSEEWVDLRSLEDCVAVFEETVSRFCGAGT